MIVSEGVGNLPATHPPDFRRRAPNLAWALLAHGFDTGVRTRVRARSRVWAAYAAAMVTADPDSASS